MLRQLPRPRMWALLVALAAALSAQIGNADDSSAGAAIYLNGRLPDGRPVVASSAGELQITGADAACVRCHRPSGLGTLEGRTVVPPIIGPYLFRGRSSVLHDLGLPHVRGYTPNPNPYTRKQLARTLRTGMRPDGRLLDPLMPRYELDDTAAQALIDYLSRLGTEAVPGVAAEEIEIGTVITPDADPARAQATLDVLERYVAQQRARAAPRVHRGNSPDSEYRVARRWKLDVWRLRGPARGWPAQLADFERTQPVFALLSGQGGADWSAVHNFCQAQHIPCLFPNVDLPVVRESDFYVLYFSRGVLLEADLMGAMLGSGQAHRLRQVWRSGDIGAAAAHALEAMATDAGWRTERTILDARGDPAAALAQAAAGLQAGDVLVLWLRPADLNALGAAPDSRIIISGLMAGGEDVLLPPDWRQHALMTYVFDPPDLRRIRMNFPMAWLRRQGLPMTGPALRTAVDTWLACEIFQELTDELLDAYVPELLIEKAEVMLSRRLSTAHYPRLGLAAQQRFASKGGYLVRVPAPGAAVGASAWIVPGGP